tara:strand:- start:190 stop:312 length:123 start_codon:yes stop_codon:yes gene_type:complete
MPTLLDLFGVQADLATNEAVIDDNDWCPERIEYSLSRVAH